MKLNFKLKKLNNKGFSLVELLIVVAILAIVVAPFLHSFVTSARTSAKASQTLTATNIAESAMEEFEAYKLDVLTAKHPIFTVDADKVYDFEIDGAYYNSVASDYSVKLKLDPSETVYSDWNNMSVSDVENINGDTCAVYAMREDEADKAIDSLASKVIAAMGSTPPNLRNDLKTTVTRNIDATITSNGQIAMPDGTFIPHVKVTVKITYTVPDAQATTYHLSGADRIYSLTYELYDNRSSKGKFSSIYLMFIPRQGLVDTFTVTNKSNIEGTVYVLSEKDASVTTSLTHKITVIEELYTSLGPNDKSALKLRTNLYTPAASGKLQDATKRFSLTYMHPTRILSNTMSTLMECFSVQTADGRNFDDTAAKDRIYTMTVEVYKGTDKLVTLTGSKLE